MEISTQDRNLRKAIENEGFAKRRYGEAMAGKLRLRIAAMRAAETLADFWPPNSGSERCHELKGDLKGLFSINLNQPFRLIFAPVEVNPPKDRLDEQERWKNIVEVELKEISNTHE